MGEITDIIKGNTDFNKQSGKVECNFDKAESEILTLFEKCLPEERIDYMQMDEIDIAYNRAWNECLEIVKQGIEKLRSK